MLAPTTRHAGSGGTRFVDINRGELHKANFTVGYATPEFVEANRLLSFLQWFESAPADPVPDNSILREFFGGSIFTRLHL